MKTTIKDVAELAGVSIATVSRVLNNKDRVNANTRKKVQQAIQALDFKPSTIARSMINNETHTIGLLIPLLSNEFWSNFAEGIEQLLWDHGYTTNLFMADNNSFDKMKAIMKTIENKRLDGIILCSVPQLPEQVKELSEMIVAANIPAVTFEFSLPGIPSVKGDHIQGGCMAVEHLIRFGHRSIAYIGGPEISIAREMGFRQAHLLHNIPCQEALIQYGKPTVDFGREAMKKLLVSDMIHTAVFCANDLLAIGAMEAIHARGLQIPQDVSVVGYDNIKACEYVTPQLTTIVQPVPQMTRLLVETLLEAKDDLSHVSNRNFILPMEIKVRGTTGPVKA
ncbi:LacI family transcriptional regulator [Paenibacillus rhizosphaerae]|uniref:LacI family transcriptional regulator n=1 Tax=Paenibacillus rhizosphaerae TaxID=297318 RepID=A0A839TPZ9_9BACL|nr:LacI family DNA-binding transcriptional regulator [Paenibacillus rhizosphaerae]MBB3128845.1 LacI family transcriptional regulator [Paenibacillus rhizosphaerae]